MPLEFPNEVGLKSGHFPDISGMIEIKGAKVPSRPPKTKIISYSEVFSVANVNMFIYNMFSVFSPRLPQKPFSFLARHRPFSNFNILKTSFNTKIDIPGTLLSVLNCVCRCVFKCLVQ